MTKDFILFPVIFFTQSVIFEKQLTNWLSFNTEQILNSSQISICHQRIYLYCCYFYIVVKTKPDTDLFQKCYFYNFLNLYNLDAVKKKRKKSWNEYYQHT